ncbi:MAG: hypothetical protein Ct9H300mP16_14180 [Pseudomonadota bacterium]|nr:MAG: hypothetical protein Ct9H300mP16_14180 [Pseudomonadota bacterium]
MRSVTVTKGADLVVINTCGFIQSAVDESLEAISEALEGKRAGARNRLSWQSG